MSGAGAGAAAGGSADVRVAEVKDVFRIERIGAHSHIRGLGTCKRVPSPPPVSRGHFRAFPVSFWCDFLVYSVCGRGVEAVGAVTGACGPARGRQSARKAVVCVAGDSRL